MRASPFAVQARIPKKSRRFPAAGHVRVHQDPNHFIKPSSPRAVADKVILVHCPCCHKRVRSRRSSVKIKHCPWDASHVHPVPCMECVKGRKLPTPEMPVRNKTPFPCDGGPLIVLSTRHRHESSMFSDCIGELADLSSCLPTK